MKNYISKIKTNSVMRRKELFSHLVGIRQVIGNKNVAKIHKTSFWKDIIPVIMLPALFGYFAYLLCVLPYSFLWFVVLGLQGFLIQSFGLAAHELFTHRKIFGSYSYYFDLLFSIPLFRRPSYYRKYHIFHHRSLNTQNDPELQEINHLGGNIRWKRWIFSSIFGQLISQLADSSYQENINLTKDEMDLKEERYIYFFVIVLLISCLWFGKYIFFGYILPMITIVPIASVFRIILEHADVDPENPLQCATFYRTNIFTKLLFFFDSGDCHLIHHLYPMLPYYHMGKAIKLIRPYLLEHGVYEHRSFLKILQLFYIKNIPLRSPWFKHCKQR